MNIMRYKGYIARIEYSEEDDEFFGTIVNLNRDQIIFGGQTVAQLKKHMREAINGHLQNCKNLKIEPEKPYSGRITYRTSPEEHAKLVEAALLNGDKSLNEWMSKILSQAIDNNHRHPRA